MAPYFPPRKDRFISIMPEKEYGQAKFNYHNIFCESCCYTECKPEKKLAIPDYKNGKFICCGTCIHGKNHRADKNTSCIINGKCTTFGDNAGHSDWESVEGWKSYKKFIKKEYDATVWIKEMDVVVKMP